MILLFLISQVRPLYVERYFVATSPAFFLLMVYGWYQVRMKPFVPMAAFGVIIVGVGLNIHHLQTDKFIDHDWRSSTLYMTDHLQTDDRIILDAPFKTVYWYYYGNRSQNQVLTNAQADALMQNGLPIELADTKRLWFFANEQLRPNKAAWLAQYEILERIKFDGIVLYLLRVPASP
jgi:hypothetical protein